MKYQIRHLLHISASREKVYEAITSLEGLRNWWTIQTEGRAEPGGIIRFRFGDMGGPDMKVIGGHAGKQADWECVESPHGWKGHRFSFKLEDHEGKTRLKFLHDGWNEQDDYYAMCNFSWGKYLESLRQYCQTGKGEAFGSPGYRT
ncbi:MAG: SRPBCC domain-containing protein [Bacteroidetes bacterium]|nr:MAG: SRPBCC domain-containing protein [Bacteroidota bacterium]REK04649.1 MAG: SRPBCC domain-containing protein [Bacteroidota bacterium]REK36124.1 MAG: SRPBCC domain-containing protein [Bacteroidota bacterium]REK51505.1 MAG: SRPBCC domain-containing protein [Bacteroidota bacterium]